MLIFKSLLGQTETPSCLADVCHFVTDESRRSLRLTDSLTLAVPRSGDGSFFVAGSLVDVHGKICRRYCVIRV
jgi:hypothetical protein